MPLSTAASYCLVQLGTTLTLVWLTASGQLTLARHTALCTLGQACLKTVVIRHRSQSSLTPWPGGAETWLARKPKTVHQPAGAAARVTKLTAELGRAASGHGDEGGLVLRLPFAGGQVLCLVCVLFQEAGLPHDRLPQPDLSLALQLAAAALHD